MGTLDSILQIKVFNDVKDPSNIECQVINIDDRPAIDVITEYAKNNISKSRDLSIRFNYALASLSFGGYGDFSIYGQSFTLRTQLPKTPSISYTLNCNDKISKITREWQVPINDKSNIVWQYKSPYINGNSVGKANLIFDAFIARFYILQDFGVVLISTEVSADSLKYHYLSDLTFGFELLATIGIKKIILDLSNNGGGDVFIAQYIAKLLFPNIQTFPLDIKVNNISIPFIEETSKIKQKVGDIFHYKTFISVNTNNSFNNVTDFIGNNTYNRSDIQLKFTSKAFLNQTAINGGILELSTPPKLPWTEKDIIILTNGICESSCALLTQRLAEINVPTISVGGFPNTQFSFATLSGGASYDTSSIVTSLGQLKNLNSSLISSLSIPSTLTLHFTLAEAYSIKNPSEVLEFSFRPADYQLYYDERSARDPSYLWIQAAKFFEK
ncbi:peptidase s41 family protein [Gigaspora margarita]|uniref:Peptidase s41 family protein n=1 Tax=Gigaspora margarita TaxID=4874 RepID=A0A8H4AZU4_GIGMA|nr:peptidase s41 family protein [Gigaspora margarita]